MEHLAHLLASRAVNARVGHAAFPIQKKQVLRTQTFEAAALEGVFLAVIYSRFDLALVPWHRRSRRQDHRTIVPTKLLHLGVEFGIKPVSPRHGGTQVVDHQRLGNPAQIAERIFQAADEALGRLPPRPAAAKGGRNFGGQTRRSEWLVLARDHPPSRGSEWLVLLAGQTPSRGSKWPVLTVPVADTCQPSPG